MLDPFQHSSLISMYGLFYVTKAYGSIEETLLLEFVYFGRLNKQTRNTKTLNTFEYLGNDLKRGEKEEMKDKNMGEEKHPDTDEDITETDKSEGMSTIDF